MNIIFTDNLDKSVRSGSRVLVTPDTCQ